MRGRCAGSASFVMLVLLAACGGAESGSGGPAREAGAARPAIPPPGTDIWIAELSRDADGGLVVGMPVNVTDRPGYDNQPYFLNDTAGFWYTVIDESGQADIWFYDLGLGAARAVTRTSPESEYSATPLPDRSGFSAVRVEADSTQRLWRFDRSGENAVPLLPDLKPVGYQAWADDSTLVLYVLGDPPTLQVVNTATGEARVVARNVGRAIQRIPGTHAVSFTQRTEDGTEIRRLDPATGATGRVAPGVDAADFHTWTPDGTLLQASGSKLYAWDPEAERWNEVADFSHLGLTLSRLAVSPDGTRIALVAEGS
ncbi:MAG: hypothetical protein ACE5GJ_14110 [Gemmatimonadota bacterium]